MRGDVRAFVGGLQQQLHTRSACSGSVESRKPHLTCRTSILPTLFYQKERRVCEMRVPDSVQAAAADQTWLCCLGVGNAHGCDDACRTRLQDKVKNNGGGTASASGVLQLNALRKPWKQSGNAPYRPLCTVMYTTPCWDTSRNLSYAGIRIVTCLIFSQYWMAFSVETLHGMSRHTFITLRSR